MQVPVLPRAPWSLGASISLHDHWRQHTSFLQGTRQLTKQVWMPAFARGFGIDSRMEPTGVLKGHMNVSCFRIVPDPNVEIGDIPGLFALPDIVRHSLVLLLCAKHSSKGGPISLGR